MFDAKSILDMLMKGAQPAPPPQQAPPGGLGGLADILGQMMGGAQKPGAAPQMAPNGQGGGLADILGQLQKQLGGAQGGAQAPAQVSGGGGLGDILGQLQKQLGGAGQGGQQQASSPAQGGGGLMDILGQVLGQATSGVREGAGRINEATGAGDRAREALGQATGKSPEELLAQLQEWIRNNPGTAAAGAGGLGAVVLGTRTGRSVAGSAIKLGALALIGGLAYKAYHNYSQGRPLLSGSDAGRLLSEPAPSGSGFEPDAISNDSAILYIRAMIAAAAADGRIDRAEQQKIIGGLQQAGIDAEAQAFLQQEIENPASVEDLAQGCSSAQEAVQVYTAARLAIDPDTEEESEFLTALAQQLGMDANLVAHIDATAAAAG
jgi:uncharacterized membrane protein YebE (DUF533 family)